MANVLGSPARSRQNAFLDRYVQQISPEKPKLTEMSSSRINSSNNLLSQLTSAAKNKISTDKANHSQPSFGKNSPFLAGGTMAEKKDKPAFDTESLSREEKGYYEFLCRVGEVKRWIEEVIQETLPSELDICVGDSLRDGVYLAQVTQRINSDLAPTVYPAGDRLQFKHTQNINAFFSLVEHVGLPSSFRFELQDLYNKKSLPQVFETIYILITLINKKWPTKTPSLQALSGKLSFTKDELRKCQRMWPRIRDFKSLSISPIASPVVNKAKSLTNDSLINDFGTFNGSEEDGAIQKSIATPTRNSNGSVLQPVVLPPPLENESISSNIYSPEKNDNDLNSPVRPTFKPKNEYFTSTTSHLEYSPLKNTSLSYYSPSISKYLTYDTDFYMRRSQARQNDLEYYNSFNYGPVEYSPKRKQKMTENEFLESIVGIQGVCRAVNIRFNFHIQRNLLKLFGREVIVLQANIRGQLLRRRADVTSILKFKKIKIPELFSIQALFRAYLHRKKLDHLRIKYLRQQDQVDCLQGFSRGFIVRRKTNWQLSSIRQSDVPLRKFQALLNGVISRSNIHSGSASLSNDLTPIKRLQAICRANLIRQHQHMIFNSFVFEVSTQRIDFQTICRAVSVRVALKDSILSLNGYDSVVEKISAHIKGWQKRKCIQYFLRKNVVDFLSVSLLQASIRGVLVRFTLDIVDDFIEYNYLIEFQARLRGHFNRSKLRERSAMFVRNSRSIVMIQSKIRMFLQRVAFFELMQLPNPTLTSVRRFAHLLNNVGTIEEVQDKLEGFQTQLDAENIKKERLEKEIGQQIDLAEVLRKHGLTEESPAIINKLTVPKNSLPTFQKLFYLLQVDPTYWKIMHSRDPAFVENNAYCCFTTMNQKMAERERTYFIRLVVEIMQCEMAEAATVDEFLANDNQLWRRFLRLFLRREFPELFDLFVPLLDFIADSGISFESDPYVIYKLIYNREPMSRSLAIEDYKTKCKFIENLRSIWHSVEIVAELFTRKTSEFPSELRFLATKIFSSAADKNAGEDDALKAISAVLLNCMVFEYLENRAYYGYEEKDTHHYEEKLHTIIDALSTVFCLHNFSGYCDPLNQYASEMNSQIKVLLLNMFLDPEYEKDGDRLIYHDMVSKAPRLEIFSDKVLKIGSKFQECLSCFPDDDAIHDILGKRIESSLIPKSGRVVLELLATSHRFLVCDDRTRKLYDQVKRAFIYMMQVEDINSNLYDLTVSCVLDSDEPAFRRLIDNNIKIKNDPIIRHLDNPPYFSLKNSTLKRIHELENMEVLNPANNKLQNFLNDIANTIKNPHYAIDYVSEELEVTHKTQLAVTKINQDLEFALAHLKKSNNDSVKAIQNTNRYLPAHKGPLSNLKGAYKKAYNKSGFEMNGLKLKWTTRQLYEKGVVTYIEGEKLAEQKVKVFGSSGPKFPDIIFKISTADGSKFGIQLLDKRKGPEKRQSDYVDSFNFKDLLNTQAGSKVDTWHLLNGKVTLKTSELLKLVVVTFLKSESI
ncbi:hypothetical protein HG535_0A06700 [Zygotorulaspora mrakii]|uniref:Calponin-homology (CH) domain-containing protein n=1 Tax=Zygotorulaspora mrakii TaxID=42260 RepID=A0A7H9AWF1_ZYGMR|nr:uncharacterized protein HG535_0A06700 [Zygotorulaspora mrakii]QLG70728.1 hypothetical protein HG535_0A06700 [Zygotorulaspora mrakii]